MEIVLRLGDNNGDILQLIVPAQEFSAGVFVIIKRLLIVNCTTGCREDEETGAILNVGVVATSSNETGVGNAGEVNRDLTLCKQRNVQIGANFLDQRPEVVTFAHLAIQHGSSVLGVIEVICRLAVKGI